MAYVNYNLPMQRTGYRPYGHSNPWSASQLNGLRAPVWYEHQVVHPFSEGGGRRLGQVQRAFSPRFLMSGLGQDASACSDFSGNFVPCGDSSCRFGPCVPAGPIASHGCMDGYGNSVMCADPACMFGGCVNIACPPGQSNQGGYCIGVTPTPIAPGPSPRVPAPITLFPPTAGASTVPTVKCPSGQMVNFASQCPPASVWTSLQNYAPLIIIGVVAVAALGGGRR